MIKFSKIDIFKFFSVVALLVFVLMSMLMNVPPLLVAALTLWGALVLYALFDMKSRIALFFFLVSFFTFLLGREVCFYYLDAPLSYKYLFPENDFAYICVIIALAGVWGGFRFRKHRPLTIRLPFEYVGYSGRFRQFCVMMMAFCFSASLVSAAFRILFVRKVGYMNSYSASLGGAGVPTVLSYLDAFFPMSLFLYLATKPKKKQALFVLALYEVYAVLTLLTGQRYPFVGINMMILLYIVIRSRSERGWISRKFVLLIICAAPLLVIFLSVYNSIRAGRTSNYDSSMDAFIGFFYDQGGSINVIKRVKYFAEQLSDMKLCSFSNVRSALLENIIMRHISDVKVYSGNSIENALYGHSLAHRLSYYTYGDAYLMGRGVGSSYIAELYHDFGYIGVFLGSAVYGYILREVLSISFRKPFQNAILLNMTYTLFFAPRGEFDRFIGCFLTLYALAGLSFVYCFYLAFRRKSTRLLLSALEGRP